MSAWDRLCSACGEFAGWWSNPVSVQLRRDGCTKASLQMASYAGPFGHRALD